MKIEDLIGKKFHTKIDKTKVDIYTIEKVNGFGKVVLGLNGKDFDYKSPEYVLRLINEGTWILIDEETEHPSLQGIENLYKHAEIIKCAKTGVKYEIDFPLIITETNKGFYNHNRYKITLYDKETQVFAKIIIVSHESINMTKTPFYLDEYIHNNDAEKRVEAQDKCDERPIREVINQICNPPSVEGQELKVSTFKEIEFDFEIQSTMQKIQELLLVKGKEYRRNNNPYHNFEVAARKKGITPERALDGFLLKHLVSYDDMLNDIEQGVLPKIEVVEEKFNDIICYMIIQKAQILNRINNGKS